MSPLRQLFFFFFAWEVAWRKVLTLDKLQIRGWHLPNRCYLCGCVEEIVHHLLLHCLLSVLSRISFSLWLGSLGSSPRRTRKPYLAGKALLWGKISQRFGSQFPNAYFGQFGKKETV